MDIQRNEKGNPPNPSRYPKTIIFFSDSQGGSFGKLPQVEVSNLNVENPLIEFKFRDLRPTHVNCTGRY